MNSDLLQGFYVGDLLVDPRKGQVIGRAGSAHLPPKAMEVLLCLASDPGQLVTRDKLISAVWGAGHASSETLSHTVSDIRHALDDHHDDPKFVQTLPKRGYRLLVEVEPAAARSSTVILGAPGNTAVQSIGLFENLKQRGVLETAIAYLVVGWLLIQVVDIIFSQLLLPAWAGTFMTVLVIAGFPIAVLLSWFLEFRDGRAIPHELSPRDSIRRRFSRTYLSVIGALVIAAVFVFAYDRSIGLPQAEITGMPAGSIQAELPPIADNSIAVLPFVNVDGSEETEIFANGLVDDVITRLSHVPGLLVSSRGDSYTLEPNSASSRVRERLRVERYLEGSVQIEGDQIRVVVQLINSDTGFHLTSRKFDRSLENFFDMRDEITELTVANVRVALPPDTRMATPSWGSDPSLDVYVLYRRGVEASRLTETEGSIDTSLGWFDAALKIDPDYAAAHAGNCEVFVKAYPVTDDPAYIENAELSCARALTLNPNLDVVHTALGDLFTATGRTAAAENAYLEALRINPNSALSLIGLGEVYRLLQRPDEAEASIRRAAGLHPGDWAPYSALGRFLYRSGRYIEAAEQYKIMVELDNSSVDGYTNLGSSLMLAGDFAAAETAYRHAIELEPRAHSYSNFGMFLYYQGRFNEAVDAHRDAVASAPQDYLARSNLGDALWATGNETEALEVLTIAKALALEALQVNPNDAFIHMDLAWINTVLGNYQEGRALIERSMSQVPDDPYVHYIDSLILSRGGDTAGALAALKTAIELGYSRQLLATDPNLAELRLDSRFDQLLNSPNPP